MTRQNDVYIVSACLLGEKCRYDNTSNSSEKVLTFLKDKKVIPVCPECMGGLPIPREASEIKTVDGAKRVFSQDGIDVTAQFVKGAEETLNTALKNNATSAILKARSPSCGAGKVYDGTFGKKLVKGNGFAAQLLIDNGIKVMTEEEL